MAIDPANITLSLHDRARTKPDGPTPKPALVVALECNRPTAQSSRHSMDGIHTVSLGRAAERTFERFEDDVGRKLSIGVPDRWMSSKHARIERSFGRWVLEDCGSKNGTFVNGQLSQRAVLRDGDIIELGHTVFLYYSALPLRRADPDDFDLAASPPSTGMATLHPQLATELDRLEQIAPSPISILIEGESGTGKEVLARAAHVLSKRKGPFIAVNCGAIPANLVESELFGYRKGAFSGATEDRIGLVRSADKGTLFLDEIGDLPPASQAALLRVLQQREVTPVGGSRPVPVDIRVMSATHRNLEEMVQLEQFRRDLFARIVGYRVTLPPLADRRIDLGMLIGTLLTNLGYADSQGFEPEAARRLFEHNWPMNIRELEQCLRTAMVLAGDGTVDIEHLPESVRVAPSVSKPEIAAQSVRLSAQDEAQRAEILQHLAEQRGNISAVARAMGKDRKQIQRWVKRFAIDVSIYRK